MGGQQSGRADGRTDGGPGEPGTPEPVQDARLLAAAARVLGDAGWQGLTVEAVAEAAGLSRVTAWLLGLRASARPPPLVGRTRQARPAQADDTGARGRAGPRDAARRFVITSAVRPRRGRRRADLLPGARRARLADGHVHCLPPGTRG